VLHLETESSLLAARRQLIADRISLGRSLGGRWMMARRQQAGSMPAASSSEDNRHEK
jgi:hypothetical protein